MAIQVNIGAAKTRLSELVAASERGEEVVLARDGKPVVRLVALRPEEELERIRAQRLAFFGSLRGQISPDIDFTEPMSEDELAEWYDAPLVPPDPRESSR